LVLWCNRAIAPAFIPVLTSLADERCATLARLIAYVGTLAMFGIVHFWDQLQADAATGPQPGPAPVSGGRCRLLDPREKSEAYDIFRHPAGGGKDVFHWGSAELFARRAEKRQCAVTAASLGWIAGAENPGLRGRL
jgi:hypothetical protein